MADPGRQVQTVAGRQMDLPAFLGQSKLMLPCTT
jgi:hypothetical protein